MGKRYKIILTNKRLYKEAYLDESDKKILIGTNKNCRIRLSRELFLTDFEISLEKCADIWLLSCEESMYITANGVMKLASKELSHGDNLAIKSSGSNQELFRINFMIDFEYETKSYDRIIDIEKLDHLTIGGSPNCQIQLRDPLAVSDNIILTKINGGWHLTEQGTGYGVYLNGVRIKWQAVVSDFDFFSIIGYSFYYKFGKLYTSRANNISLHYLKYEDIALSKEFLSYPKFNRNTRIRSVIPKDPIQVLDPPEMPEKPKNNLLTSLIPAVMMLALTILLRGVMSDTGGSFIIFSACSMGLGIVTSIFAFIGGKRQYKKDVKDREKKYNQYIENKRQEIAALRQEEKNLLDSIYFSCDIEYELVKNFSGYLFDRTCQDEDFLHVRLGIGALSARREINYKAQETLEVKDELANMPEQLSKEFALIKQAPVVSDFINAGAVGIVGENNHLYDMMKNMVLDICIRQYHKDINIFFLIDQENAHLIYWARLLPHLYNDFLGVRNIICDDDSKNLMFEYLYKELSYRETAKEDFMHYVIFVFDDMGIKQHPISKYIEKAKELALTFVFFENHLELLPQGCGQIIYLGKNDTTGQLINSEDSNCAVGFNYEPITEIKASFIAEKLAPIYSEEISLEGTLTKNINFYQLLEIQTAEDLDLSSRWSNSTVNNSMAAPLGVKSKNEIVYLDLHDKAHGPHGLVAGTTGSGKSEILQSYILSMATLYHPYEVSFMIIDFKGGGMVNQFRNLPHLVGSITNIDGREIERSLKSIKAELRKRQHLFATAGVNHINNYIKKYKGGEVNDPVPHLIVIVDEFAELKAEQPEFMKELISASRIGRSLGVHLILATQKPAGQVNEQIWSNSRFKLCLKVQTKEDSNEVLKSPLAAEIKEPGRSYLQVGNNELFELFQSAYSGAPAKIDDSGHTKEFFIGEVSLSGKIKKVYEQKRQKSEELVQSQLDTIVEYVNNHCISNHIRKLPSICLPPLPEIIFYDDTSMHTNKHDVSVNMGIYDDPTNQYQGPAIIDIEANNLLIIGSAQFGKTNLLQLIIRSMASLYTPKEVNFYIIDFGSMVLKNFEDLSHVGGVVTSSEDEKMKNLFKLLNKEVAIRKEKLINVGVSSFVSYKEAGYTDLPQIILIIDNFTALKELYLQDEDSLLPLCRDGIAVGINIILTNSQTAGIGFRYLSNFSVRIGLYCNDSSEYNSIFDYCRMRPLNVQGRCLIDLDKTIYECQTYLAFQGEKEIERVKEMREFILQRNLQCGECRAKQIPEIPQLLTAISVYKQFPQSVQSYNIVLGLDYSSVAPVTIDLASLGVLAVTGRKKFGKSNFIRNIIHTIEKNKAYAPAEIAIIDDVTRKFSDLQELDIVKHYSLSPELAVNVINEWEDELTRRYTLLLEGNNDVLESVPLLMLIIQNQDVSQFISSNKDLLAKYKNITSKYKAMKICIIYSNIENTSIPYSAPDVLKAIKDSRHYMAFEDISNLKLLDIPLSIARSFKKPIEIGDCYYIKDNDVKKLKTALNIEESTKNTNIKINLHKN